MELIQSKEVSEIGIPIKGFQKTSLLDFPSKISSIIFLGGCNFRCGFCYNPSLVFNKISTIPVKEVLDGLLSRKKYIDGVVITGGEPTLCKDLPLFIKEIKKLGLAVKLDTNGTNPSMLKELLNNGLVDYVAMDIKAPLNKYSKVAGVNVDTRLIDESAKILLNSNIDYEFRTTLVKEDLSEDDIVAIGLWLKGGKKYCLQQFRNNTELVDNSYRTKNTFTREEMEMLKKRISGCFGEIVLRFG